LKPPITHTHHGLTAKLNAYGPAPLRTELVAASLSWLVVWVSVLIVASAIAGLVEWSGAWLVNERVMAAYILQISAPSWLAVYALGVFLFRKGQWVITLDQRSLNLQWRRLGRGANWTIPLQGISAATVGGHPKRLTLHFQDERILRLDAGAHYEEHLEPIAEAIERAAREVASEPSEPIPDPPRELMALLSRGKQTQ